LLGVGAYLLIFNFILVPKADVPPCPDTPKMGKMIDGRKEGVWIDFKNKYIFYQEFKKGMKDGLHVVWDKDCQLLKSGFFKKGRMHGEWSTYYRNEPGDLLKNRMHYENGIRDGLTQNFDKDGKVLREGNYKDGKRDGQWLLKYDQANTKYVGSFKDGKREGEFKEFRKDGTVRSVGYYRDDKKSGIWKQYDKSGKELEQKAFDVVTKVRKEGAVVASDSKLAMSSKNSVTAMRPKRNSVTANVNKTKTKPPSPKGRTNRKGLKIGKWTYYHPTGGVWFSISYKGGKRHGKWTSYHQNGKMESVGYYKNDRKDGTWTYFDQNGNPDSVEIYKKGRKVE
jgi:uncharacterized protein